MNEALKGVKQGPSNRINRSSRNVLTNVVPKIRNQMGESNDDYSEDDHLHMIEPNPLHLIKQMNSQKNLLGEDSSGQPANLINHPFLQPTSQDSSHHSILESAYFGNNSSVGSPKKCHLSNSKESASFARLSFGSNNAHNDFSSAEC